MLTEMRELQGTLLEKASLAQYTSWQVGGKADYIYVPKDKTDLAKFLPQIPVDMPVLWLGLGSNVLIRDGGIEGVVIVTQGALGQIEALAPQLIRVEAGVSCAQFARYSARLGLTGAEFMAGIPGTVGGALTMNAGCYGGETWNIVQSVETINRAGDTHIRLPQDFEIAYRHAKGPANEWFVAGRFKLAIGNKEEALRQIKLLLSQRNAAQPTNLPNCGSVFRNPPNNYAARLIEQCGLKNLTIGGASVSTKHANFIINQGNASAADIESLILRVQKIVLEKEGVRLIPEVCILGKK